MFFPLWEKKIYIYSLICAKTFSGRIPKKLVLLDASGSKKKKREREKGFRKPKYRCLIFHCFYFSFDLIFSPCTCKTLNTFFFPLRGHICSIWKFSGQGSSWSCSCQPVPQPQQCGIQAVSATYTPATATPDP